MDSPCIKVCIIDPDTSVCSGCYRTLPEIAKWAQFSTAERRHIMASLAARALQTAQLTQPSTRFSGTGSERRAADRAGKA
jgi:uncharacterized protein